MFTQEDLDLMVRRLLSYYQFLPQRQTVRLFSNYYHLEKRVNNEKLDYTTQLYYSQIIDELNEIQKRYDRIYFFDSDGIITGRIPREWQR